MTTNVARIRGCLVIVGGSPEGLRYMIVGGSPKGLRYTSQAVAGSPEGLRYTIIAGSSEGLRYTIIAGSPEGLRYTIIAGSPEGLRYTSSIPRHRLHVTDTVRTCSAGLQPCLFYHSALPSM
ncbi:hypothetical protein BH24ACI5_BH24ACI5_20690 [soil metagenome]